MQIWLGRSFAAVSEGETLVASRTGFGGADTAGEWLKVQIAARPGRRRLNVLLGSGLARPFVFKPPRGLKSRDELVAVATAHAGEEAGWDEEVRVWLSAPDAAGQRLGVAAASAALDCIERMATASGSKLLSIRAGWATLTDDALEPSNASELLLASDPDGQVALAADSQRWLWAGSLDRSAAEAGGESWQTRLAVRLQIEAQPAHHMWQDSHWVRTPPTRAM